VIGRKGVNLIVGWCGRFLFFVVPRQFSQVVGEWPENQILIPDWTYFYCPGATLGNDNGEWPENQILIPDWTYFHCPNKSTNENAVSHGIFIRDKKEKLSAPTNNQISGITATYSSTTFRVTFTESASFNPFFSQGINQVHSQ